jgi:hypothetical protein
MADSQAMTDARVLRAWTAALDVLGELVAEIRAAGATPVVFLIPRAVQVDGRYHADFREAGFEVPDDMATTNTPQRHLGRWCDDQGVAWVDALPALRRAHTADPALRHWFRYDVHLNAAGNAALAEALVTGLAALPAHQRGERVR